MRALKTRNGASEEIQARRSIVAGLGEANSLAKIIVYSICEDYEAKHTKVKLNTFVDDMAQMARGEEMEVAVNSAKAGRDMALNLQAAGFKISPKSVFLTNSERVDHIVKCTMEGSDIRIKAVSKAADLGIDLSSNHRRSNAKRGARFKAAEAKAARIAKLRGSQVRARMTNTVTMA